MPVSDAIAHAVRGGTTAFDIRYRYEWVDQDGIDRDAHASTVRARLTWTSADLDGWTAGVEADQVAVIGSERYNSTSNGQTRYPVVADPEGFDLNQAWIGYRRGPVAVTGGRQRILHADQRFVGGVAWRQNEQTYDALRIRHAASDRLDWEYAYVWNVNRVFGPDDGAQPAAWHGNSHLFTGTLQLTERHSLSAYAYRLDFRNANGPPNATFTRGLGYHGSFGPLAIQAAIAQQSDHADSPLDYTAEYYQLRGTRDFGGVKVTLGYEVLGSDDGIAGFRTPLATLHGFQGWADQFLATPDDGIRNAYATLAGNLGPVAMVLGYHHFRADHGGADYGQEWNLSAGHPLNSRVSLHWKLARYEADTFATDTVKGWFTVQLKL